MAAYKEADGALASLAHALSSAEDISLSLAEHTSHIEAASSKVASTDLNDITDEEAEAELLAALQKDLDNLHITKETPEQQSDPPKRINIKELQPA